MLQVPAYTLNQPERQYVDVARRYPNATLPLDFVKLVCSWMQVAFVET
jgi:BURAN domain